MIKSKKNLDELAIAKMEQMEKEIKSGKRKVYSESEVKKKLGIKKET